MKDKFICSQTMYENICKFQLYNDPEINEALIEYIKNNYFMIDFDYLENKKLNKEIVETLIEIRLKEKLEILQLNIEKVLVKQYDILKDLKYDVEDLIKDKFNIMLYKKIMHFSKKDVDELYEMFMEKIINKKDDKDDYESEVEEIIIKAMGIVLTQTEKGIELLKNSKLYCEKRSISYNDIVQTEIIETITFSKNEAFLNEIIAIYMVFIDCEEECLNYFSSINPEKMTEELIDYIEFLGINNIGEDVCEIISYVNSEKLDDYIISKIDEINDLYIKVEMLGNIAGKNNKKYIPYFLNFYEKNKKIFNKNKYNDEKEQYIVKIAPLLMLEECQDEISKEIINIYETFEDYAGILKEGFDKVVEKLKELEPEVLLP